MNNRTVISAMEIRTVALLYRMAKIFGILAFLAILVNDFSVAQMRITGQASVGFMKGNQGNSQYSYNRGRGSFNWRGDLLGDAVLSEDITFLSNVRFVQDDILHVDQFAVRFSDIGAIPLNIEFGEIDLPFLNLGARRYPSNNSFIDLPLIREHHTTLRSSDYELWLLDSRYTEAKNGLHILDGGLYDLGLRVFGTIGMFDISAAITNGMVSASSSYTTDGLNSSGGIGKMMRVAATPMTGLTIGVSYANGPFLSEGNYYYPSYGESFNPDEYSQEILGGDIDFSFDHFSFYGEGIYNVWKLAHIYGSDLKALGYSLEGRYAALPRVSLAARVGGLVFNKISTTIITPGYGLAAYSGTWDHDLLRFEVAAGYRLSRESLLKVVYQWNNTYGLHVDPADNVFAIQAAFSF